jgi:multiple sugar transport system permease protein
MNGAGAIASARRRRRTLVEAVLTYAGAVLLATFLLAPFVWLLISSLAPLADLIQRPLHWIPPHASFDRYRAIFFGADGRDFRFALRNSAIVAGTATTISLVAGMFGAYALSRFPSRGRSGLLYLMLATYMTPPVAILLPLYLILSRLGLLNNVLGLALVYTSFLTPFLTWILKGFFDAIPEELEEAARIDGASRVGSMVRVILPLSLPGVITAVLFGIILAWDEFLYALIFTSSDAAKTLPVAISEFTSRFAVDYGLMAAGGIIAALPPLILAFALQRYLIAGLTAGSVKG